VDLGSDVNWSDQTSNISTSMKNPYDFDPITYFPLEDDIGADAERSAIKWMQIYPTLSYLRPRSQKLARVP
jgi:hypothetical protein